MYCCIHIHTQSFFPARVGSLTSFSKSTPAPINQLLFSTSCKQDSTQRCKLLSYWACHWQESNYIHRETTLPGSGNLAYNIRKARLRSHDVCSWRTATEAGGSPQQSRSMGWWTSAWNLLSSCGSCQHRNFIQKQGLLTSFCLERWNVAPWLLGPANRHGCGRWLVQHHEAQPS